MADGNVSSATTTNLANVVPDFIVDSIALDVANVNKTETYWYFSDATKNFGYYFKLPEIKSAADALCTWAVGKGWEVENKPDALTEMDLEHLSGNGKDSFQTIMWNHMVTKLIVGDSFAEIVTDKKGRLINLIPISPERVRLVYDGNQLKRYDVWNSKKWTSLKKEKMLHSSNNKIGDSLHGISQIDSVKDVIDFHNEVLADMRKLSHRDMALGIAYYKTSNTGKISYANTQIEQAVKNGEMLGLPEDTVEIKEFPSKNPSNKLDVAQYTENKFYQTFGVPRSIVSSDGTSEVGGKMGHIIFEVIYSRQQQELEQDLWNQMSIKIKFNRPPSLGGVVQEEEAANTGQIGIQPNDVEASITRE